MIQKPWIKPTNHPKSKVCTSTYMHVSANQLQYHIDGCHGDTDYFTTVMDGTSVPMYRIVNIMYLCWHPVKLVSCISSTSSASRSVQYM